VTPIVEAIIPLDHLCRLTDCFGMIQHADHAVPDYETGYTTDDNARALLAALKHYRLHEDKLSRELAARYLAFLKFVQREDGRFRNFLGYDKRFLDEEGSEDTFERSLCALAYLLCYPPCSSLVNTAEQMFNLALPHVERMESPRGRACSLIALYWWAQARPQELERAREMARPLADYLVNRYNEHRRSDWEWILPEMTYGNAKLPEALFRAWQLLGDEKYLEVAKRTFGFLCEKTFVEDVLCVVGNNGWYSHQDHRPPLYDQQPIDAMAMVEAALAAYDATREAEYLRRAQISLEWFFGRNLQGKPLYDEKTGGCFDGLTETGVNQNRGAESTLALLLAHLSMREVRQAASA
jgi:uncharacterized protein YyaL (SSP411 family)